MADNDDSGEDASDAATEAVSSFFVLFSTLLAFVLILSKFLQDNSTLRSILPEASMILLIAMAAGGIVELLVPVVVLEDDAIDINNNSAGSNNNNVGQALLQSFSPTVFFVALLPPIIFHSGYHVRRQLLWQYLLPIGLYAVVGTVVSCIVVTIILVGVQNLGWIGGGEDAFQPSKCACFFVIWRLLGCRIYFYVIVVLN